MAKKLTFTVDDETVRRLNAAAARERKPKSQIIREAVADYYARVGKLSERERLRLLEVLDGVASEPRTRPASAVRREMAEVRDARRGGGRRS